MILTVKFHKYDMIFFPLYDHSCRKVFKNCKTMLTDNIQHNASQ